MENKNLQENAMNLNPAGTDTGVDTGGTGNGSGDGGGKK